MQVNLLCISAKNSHHLFDLFVQCVIFSLIIIPNMPRNTVLLIVARSYETPSKMANPVLRIFTSTLRIERNTLFALGRCALLS